MPLPLLRVVVHESNELEIRPIAEEDELVLGLAVCVLACKVGCQPCIL